MIGVDKRWLGACVLVCGCGFEVLGAGSAGDADGGSSGSGSTAMASSGGAGTSSVGTATTGTATTTGSTTSATSGPEAATGSTGTNGIEPLPDEGLVVRYYVDEPADAVVQALQDSASDPLELAVVVEGSQPFSEDSGTNRGLSYDTEAAGGRAWAPVADTKVQARLEGAQAYTLEAVVTVSAGGAAGSRIIHIGDPTAETTNFGMSYDDQGDFNLRLNGHSEEVIWQMPELAGSGRRVVHLVVDSTLEAVEDRARLYFDGQDVGVGFAVNGPELNEGIGISSNATLELFNRGLANRSFLGTGHYAAIYDIALSPDRVAEHAAILTASDDGPL